MRADAEINRCEWACNTELMARVDVAAARTRVLRSLSLQQWLLLLRLSHGTARDGKRTEWGVRGAWSGKVPKQGGRLTPELAEISEAGLEDAAVQPGHHAALQRLKRLSAELETEFEPHFGNTGRRLAYPRILPHLQLFALAAQRVTSAARLCARREGVV